MVDPDSWVGDGSSFNIEFANGGGEIVNIRIDSDTEVASWEEGPDPTATWVITGIGGQFDGDAPFLEGYQLYPRYISDFDVFTGTKDELQVEVTLYPNPTFNYLNIESDVEMDRYVVYNNFGQLIMQSKFQKTLDVKELPSGGYILVLYKDDKSKAVHFVK
jgi:hypothetical protein